MKKRYSEMTGKELYNDWKEFNAEIRNDPEKKKKYLSVWGECDGLILDNDLIVKAWLHRVRDGWRTIRASLVYWEIPGDPDIPEHLINKVLIRLPGYNRVLFFVREHEES